MAENQEFNPTDFTNRFETMTNDEMFGLMQDLEAESEGDAVKVRDTNDVFAKIALVETAIEIGFLRSCWHPRRIGSNAARICERADR